MTSGFKDIIEKLDDLYEILEKHGYTNICNQLKHDYTLAIWRYLDSPENHEDVSRFTEIYSKYHQEFHYIHPIIPETLKIIRNANNLKVDFEFYDGPFKDEI